MNNVTPLPPPKTYGEGAAETMRTLASALDARADQATPSLTATEMLALARVATKTLEGVTARLIVQAAQEGASQRAIAKALGVNPRTVRSRMPATDEATSASAHGIF